MGNLIIMAAVLSFPGRHFGTDKPPSEIAEIYTDRREQFLKLNEQDLPNLKGKRVRAVLMETAFPETAYTLVATADGAASLHFSNGGGIVGAGGHEDVRPESLKMMKMAADDLNHMEKAEQFRVAQPGKTAFYVITPKGLFRYSAKEDDLGEERDKKLSPRFHQGHELIGQMRMAGEKQRAEHDGSGEGE